MVMSAFMAGIFLKIYLIQHDLPLKKTNSADIKKVIDWNDISIQSALGGSSCLKELHQNY